MVLIIDLLSFISVAPYSLHMQVREATKKFTDIKEAGGEGKGRAVKEKEVLKKNIFFPTAKKQTRMGGGFMALMALPLRASLFLYSIERYVG